MGMNKIPSVWRKVNVFVEGIGFLGQAESVKVPTIKTKKEFAVGQWVDTGILEQLEADVEIRDISAIAFESLAKLGEASIKCKGSMFDNGAEKSLVATMVGSIDVEMDTWKMTEAARMKIKIYPYRYILEIGGKESVKIDTRQEICVVGGKDIYQSLRGSIS